MISSYSTPNNHSHIFIKPYQTILKRFVEHLVLKIIFDKVRLSFYNFEIIGTIESKLSKQVLVPQLCIHLDHI